MSIRGGCKCNNIEVIWHTVDRSLIPRKCQCDYCSSKSVSYVSKSGTRVEIDIREEKLHHIHHQGTMSADFHECRNCGELVFVTAEIEGELYVALNACCINNSFGFSAPVSMKLHDQTVNEKKLRWRQNWCHPVTITSKSRSDGDSSTPV